MDSISLQEILGASVQEPFRVQDQGGSLYVYTCKNSCMRAVKNKKWMFLATLLKNQKDQRQPGCSFMGE